MGFELDGYIARLETLQAWRRLEPSFRFLPLPGDVLGFRADGADRGAALSAKGAVVAIEASAFGDRDAAHARLWIDGVGSDVELEHAFAALGAPGATLEGLGLERNTARLVGLAAVASLPVRDTASIAALLVDPDRSVRAQAATELVQHGGAVPHLVATFLRDDDYGVRLAAASALGKLGGDGLAALHGLRAGPLRDHPDLPFLGDRAILAMILDKGKTQ